MYKVLILNYLWLELYRNIWTHYIITPFKCKLYVKNILLLLFEKNEYFTGETKDRQRGWFPRICAKQDISLNGHFGDCDMDTDHVKAE